MRRSFKENALSEDHYPLSPEKLMDGMLKKAVLPAAGLGTRFLPATKASPKEMLPIVDKPLIQYAVEEAISCGINDFIIITGKNKRAIEDHFDSAYRLEENLRTAGKKRLLDEINKLNAINLAYIRQRNPLGLGHAVLCAKPFTGGEPFAVMLSDDVIDPDFPLLREMIGVFLRHKRPVVALEEVPRSEVQRYGVVKGRRNGDLVEVTDLVEKPRPEDAPSNFAVLGRYILTPDIFDALERIEPGAGGEIQLTDALRKVARKTPIYGYLSLGKRYDAGDKLGFLKATVDFALKNRELSSDFMGFLRERVKAPR